MRYTAQELHAITEVQTSFHWIADFSGPPFGALDTPLKMRMTSGQLPQFQHAGLNVGVHGYEFPEPGVIKKNGEITLTAFETVGHEIAQPIFQWASNVYSSEDSNMSGRQLVAHQQLFGTVTIGLQNKEESRVTATYTLQKCIVGGFDPGAQLTDGGTVQDYFKPVITLRYAWFNFGLGGGKNL